MRISRAKALKPPGPVQDREATDQRRTAPGVSLRDFFAYLGPTLIVSLAYIDPGNFGTDIAGGAAFGYDLVWAVWMAGMFAMVLQYASGKLGIATGHSLSQLVRISLKSRYQTIAYWLMAELAIAATDLAEYLGTVIALNLLFGVPLLYAGVLGAVDTVLLLALLNNRFRTIEYFFMVFVSIIAIGFIYELIIVGPNLQQLAIHSLSPDLSGGTILVVVGIVGATVMPHALWVHSSLTQGKVQRWGVGAMDVAPRRKMLRLHLGENAFILAIASCVNVAILVTAAAAFYPKYSSVQQISQAYTIMEPIFGPLAAVIFGVTLLASGIASSTVGTLAGQELMTSLLGVRVNKYLRRIVTRVINVIPTTLAILIGLSPLSLLVYSQVLLSLFIPLPMIPLVYFTSKKRLMGEFVNKRWFSILLCVVAGTIIALNVDLLYTALR
jgi:manganese transport protein